VWLMERLVFQPIRAAWSERNKNIQLGLAASTEGRDEAEQAREEVRRILAAARQQAQAGMDEASAEGNRIRDQLIAQATEEFRRLLDEARIQIVADSQQTAEQLQDRIVDVVLLAAARVTGKSYDDAPVRELAAAVVQREGLR